VVERTGWVRRVIGYWGFVVVVGSLGMLAVVPFGYEAARLRTRSLWLLTAGYAIVDGALWLLIYFMPEDAAGEPATGPAMTWFFLVLVTVTGGCVQLSRLRRQGGGDGSIAAVARRGSVDRYRVVHCALLSVDVEQSGDERRDSEAFVQLRRALFQIMEDALEFSGITWSSCLRHDTGDGMIVVVPSEFPKSRLLYPMLERLAASLRHHNRYASQAIRIRLRVAIHAGDVRVDDYGITGRPKVLLARLLDAGPLRGALAEAPDTATVAVIVSDSFYDDVICHGHKGVDPRLYVPVTVRVKETEARAWLHVPGHALPMNDLSVI
jgi:hypothetical protein